MASNMYGGNLEQLRALSQKFNKQGQAVIALEKDISAAVQPGATAWEGPVANRFRQAWQGEFVPALNKLNEALQEASKHVADRTEAIQVATA